MVEITGIMSHTPASRCDIKKGDVLVSINSNPIADVLDYMFYAAESELKLVILRNGVEFSVDVRKSEYDDLGLEFESFLMDEKKSCHNK